MNVEYQGHFIKIRYSWLLSNKKSFPGYIDKHYRSFLAFKPTKNAFMFLIATWKVAISKPFIEQVFHYPNLMNMKLNTTNPHYFTYKTDEQLNLLCVGHLDYSSHNNFCDVWL